MKTSVLLLFSFLVGVALAGCVSEGGEQSGDDATPAGDATVTDETGAIEGAVVTEEGLPVAGATVGIPQVDASGSTDAEGRFALSGLAPGVYQLFVQKLGFESKGVRADVRAGDVTTVEVQLAEVAIAEARHTTVIWNGYMKCSAGIWNLGYSEECGEGLGTPVGTFGKDPNNKIDWDFEMTAKPETLLTETTWLPATAAASGMRVLIIKNLVCDPVCGWDEGYADEETGPPVRLVVDGKDLADEEVPVMLTVRHWAAIGEGPTDPVKLITEQPFEVYKTEFFGVPMEDVDPEFSALPPA